MDVLRREMKDKSEGELYHAWMCNIKFAVNDCIPRTGDSVNDAMLLHACEMGAKTFLDRLLKEHKCN